MQFMTSWEKRGWKKGLREGLKEGRQATLQETVLRLLQRRFGTLESSVQERVKRLRLAQLERLTEDLLEFAAVAEVTAWLDRHAVKGL